MQTEFGKRAPNGAGCRDAMGKTSNWSVARTPAEVPEVATQVPEGPFRGSVTE